MADDKKDPNRGNLIANINPKATADNKLPGFEGKLTFPGHDEQRHFTLWAHKTKTGALMFTGRAAESGYAQISNLIQAPAPPDEHTLSVAQKDGRELKLKPLEIVLFTNPTKEGKRPDFYGYFNSGDDDKPLKVSVWQRTGDKGRVYLTGSLERDEGPTRSRTKDRDLDRDYS